MATTDGAIRSLIQKGNLDAKVKNIANCNYNALGEEGKAKVKVFMRKYYYAKYSGIG